MNITTAAWRLNRCNHTSTPEPFLLSKPLCWIFCWPAFCIAVQQTDRPENTTPFQPMCTFLKSCLIRTMVACLTSHSKPKGKGCLQWPQRRDLPVIRQLVNLTFSSEARFFMTFSSSKIASGYTMPSCLLILPWSCCPCAGDYREHKVT